MTKNRVYSLETKMEAIRLREEGVPVKEIQEKLNIKSESQVYTWWYWHRDNELFRLEQRPGKQYSFGHGPEGTTPEESLRKKNEILQNQVKILKKYLAKERNHPTEC